MAVPSGILIFQLLKLFKYFNINNHLDVSVTLTNSLQRVVDGRKRRKLRGNHTLEYDRRQVFLLVAGFYMRCQRQRRANSFLE